MKNKDEPKLNTSICNESPVAGIVHVLLFHEYSIFLFAIILGIILDGMSPHFLFNDPIYQNMGMTMIVLGSFLIYWAQASTTNYKGNPGEKRDITFFLRGPYKYTRNPTNLGVTIMSLGLGFLLGAPISVVFICIVYIISRLFFIKKQDAILEQRYGDVFDEYRKRVKDWL